MENAGRKMGRRRRLCGSRGDGLHLGRGFHAMLRVCFLIFKGGNTNVATYVGVWVSPQPLVLSERDQTRPAVSRAYSVLSAISISNN